MRTGLGWPAGRGHRRKSATRAGHRLSDHHQGIRWRRRPRHACGAFGSISDCRHYGHQGRGARRVRQRRGVHGEVSRATTSHRIPGTCGRSGQRRTSWRTRLLDAATAPESHRGSAGSRHHRGTTTTDRRAMRQCLPRNWLSQRRHLRIPIRKRRVLFHRNEHAPAGRAPGHRNDHRRRYRPRTTAHRERRKTRYHAGRCPDSGPRDRMPHQRRGPEDFHAISGARDAVALTRRTRHPRRQPRLQRLQGTAFL